MRKVPQLRDIREELAMSQRDLAALSGIARHTIAQLERGERKARPSTLRKLAEALSVEPSVLLGEKRNTPEARPVARANKFLANLIEKDEVQWKERAAREREWEAEGKWAEYYVAGEAAHVDNAPDDLQVSKAWKKAWENESRLRNEDDYLRNILRLPEGAIGEERNVAWGKLDSNNLSKTVEVAEETPRVIRQLVDTLGDKLGSFEAIPDRYFQDPTARQRIERLRVALERFRQEVTAAVSELLELHAQSLRRLEQAVDEMKKEGGELENLMHRVGN